MAVRIAPLGTGHAAERRARDLPRAKRRPLLRAQALMLADRRVHGAGRHRDDADAARREFDGPAPGERLQRRFGRGVHRVARPRALADRRTDVDDRARGRGQRGHGRLYEERGRDQIGREQRAEGVGRERAETSLPDDAGVVDQHVEPAERTHHRVDDAFGLTRPGDVGGQCGDRRPAPGRLGQWPGPAPDREHARPLGRERPGGRSADAGPRAGHHDDPRAVDPVDPVSPVDPVVPVVPVISVLVHGHSLRPCRRWQGQAGIDRR